MPQVRLAEAVPLSEAATGTPAGRRFRARLISGNTWGSSGYYSAEALEAAATERVFAEGTPIYLDHPTATEHDDRPERSVRDLAGKITTDAVYESDGLYADIEVYSHFAPVIEEMFTDIGMSIRATAEVEQGEADGRRGTIISRFDEAMSVDFVTRAGAGGKVVAILESARVREATVNDTREALQDALRDSYGGEDSWVWVRDFDESTVWYEHETPDESGTYAEGYTLSDGGAVTLAGERTEVRVRTEYVPATRSDGNTTESLKEDTMPQIGESELAQLREASGRVPTLESERDTAVQERDTERQAREAAESERDQLRAREAATTRARNRVNEANGDLPAATVDRIVAEATRTVPLTDTGELDEAAFDTATDTARTAEESYLAGLREAAGIGAPRGFGRPKDSGDDAEVSEADLDSELGDVFGITVKGA